MPRNPLDLGGNLELQNTAFEENKAYFDAIIDRKMIHEAVKAGTDPQWLLARQAEREKESVGAAGRHGI